MTDNQLDRSQDSHNYHYDSAQRFTKMERGTIGGTPSFYQGYTLDALANWSSFNNNGTTESRSHDVMNSITFRGATSLTNDLNGNLTNDGNQKYIWDELNRLVEVRDSGNNIICDYYYNADNLRVEKHHAGGAKEQFYYDGATVLVDTDGSQTKVREYVNSGQYIDEVILVVNGSAYNYYMSDLRYCVTGFIDASGNIVERAKYDGYGKRTLLDASYAVITTANVSQSYGYTGIRHDNESELQYYRARYFDNNLGRFINHDPLGYVDGMNLYSAYFINNSLDPSGLIDYVMQGCVLKVIVRWKMKYIGKGWTQKTKQDFKDKARQQIQSAWGDQHVFKGNPCCKKCPTVKVKIEIRIFETMPTWDFEVSAYRVTSFRQSFIDRGGKKAELDTLDLKSRSITSSTGTTYNQVPIAHEFGHMLGLDHPGNYGPKAVPPSQYNTGPDYEADPASIMGLGNIVRPADFNTLFGSHVKVPECSTCTWRVQ